MMGVVWDCIHMGWVPFLMMATVLPPMLWPVLRARSPLRLAQAKPYLIHLWAGVAVGAVSSWVLWPFLFGDGLKHGSTASFIFLVAPIYGVMTLFVAYGLAELVDRMFFKGRALAVIPTWARRMFWLPVAILGIMLLGLFTSSAHLLRLTLPEAATDPETLRLLVNADDLLAPTHRREARDLASNRFSPADVLEKLSLHGDPRVRAQVAVHAHTDLAVLRRLSQDCAPEVRQAAQPRLDLQSAQAGQVGPPLSEIPACTSPLQVPAHKP